MANNKDYIVHIHDQSEITDLKNFLDQDGGSIALFFKDKEEEFLNYSGDTGISNRKRIKQKYDSYEEKDNDSKVGGDLLLKLGTQLLIPKDVINSDILAGENVDRIYETNSFTTFLASKLRDLLNDKKYTQVSANSNKLIGVTKDIFPQVTAWMWVRALSPSGETLTEKQQELQGSFIDVSPFIQSIRTTTSETGGSFEINLSPLVCEPDLDNGWQIKRGAISNYFSNSIRNNYAAHSGLHTLDMLGDLKRNQFYFHNIIGSNDLVFIRFETLDLEVNDRNRDQNKFGVSKGDLPGKIYDMIGLVDANSITTNPTTNEVGIQISGRDLTKVIIEDGCYFYLEAFAGNIFARNQENESLVNRVYGQIENFSSFLNRSIESSLNFIINQLSNTGLVPDSVFEAYGESRNRAFRRDVAPRQDLTDSMELHKQNAKISIRSSRRLSDLKYSDKAKESEEIDKIYDELYEFVSYLDANKLTIVNGPDLKGWKKLVYKGQSLIVDQYPSLFKERLFDSDASGIFKVNPNASMATNFIFKFITEEKKAKDFKPPINEELKRGVWQIIDLQIDPSVRDLRIVDTSISTATGSILNFIQKVCQEPFVEFHSDTYGDRYHFMVRRPPFNESALKELIYGGVNTEHGVEVENPKELVIDINEEDILNEQLSFDDGQVYSWFMLRPQGWFSGSGSSTSLAFLPAIYLPEFVEVWGSRPLEITTNYIPFQPIEGNGKDGSVNRFERQAFRDLKYLIDTHTYLPFTRKGMLQINGDRRIKKGTTVRLKSTGEIFYVTSVSHFFTISEQSIDRITTLEVSRGMKEEYIKGVRIPGIEKTVSYFNIVNTELNEEFLQRNSGNINVEVLNNWKVNKEIFNFFLLRNQFKGR